VITVVPTTITLPAGTVTNTLTQVQTETQLQTITEAGTTRKSSLSDICCSGC
jgi:hypothetical protein